MEQKINFRLSTNLLKDLDQLCHEDNCNRSVIIRQALQKYLANKTGNKMEDTR